MGNKKKKKIKSIAFSAISLKQKCTISNVRNRNKGITEDSVEILKRKQTLFTFQAIQ